MILRMILVLTLVLNVVACSEDQDPAGPTPAGKLTPVTPRVIYGSDNRLDIYQVTNPAWRNLAQSTAALIRNNKLSARPGGQIEIKTANFGTSYGLCEDEPFREQNAAAFCSGFFVGGDYMVTAGHCIKSQADCENTSFVFGFAITSAGVNPERVSDDEVYRCRKVIHTQTDSNGNGADFAVVELDRNVEGRSPLKLRKSGTAAIGNDLTVIGHPVGLPTKVASQGLVRAVTNGFLVASLDTYGGNSGSAVFNSASGEIEGILVRGEMDFVYKGSCRVSNKCPQNECRGEDVTRIDQVLPHLPQF